MSTKIVVGTQWGDEGKGKIIDILASDADVIIRSQGGNNAGHTVEYNGETYKLHLIPSGILYPKTSCLIGCGVVVDPQAILQEIDDLIVRGVDCKNLKMDPRLHIIMPWHQTLDHLSEEALGSEKIGTTGRGIGPCYMDKYERTGIRLYDLMHEDIFRKKARLAGERKNQFLKNFYHTPPIDIEKTIEQYLGYAQRLKPFLADVSVLVYEAMTAGKKVLFEGAQATLLDIDIGTYPYVTSSHPVSGGCLLGAGVGPTAVDDIIGVAKAYTTRVGMGPFVTELSNSLGDTIRDRGQEYGTTTGRPRRVGWFDAVVIRHAVRTGGLTSLAVNKLDTLSDVGDLKICVAYEKSDGSRLSHFPVDINELKDCTPIYKTVSGFTGDLSTCTSFEQLPQACKEYLEYLEELVDCPITMVGVGPARSQNLTRK